MKHFIGTKMKLFRKQSPFKQFLEERLRTTASYNLRQSLFAGVILGGLGKSWDWFCIGASGMFAIVVMACVYVAWRYKTPDALPVATVSDDSDDSNESMKFDINPATGLIMNGCVDARGNAYGCSDN
jgi:hypothetical protein